MSRKHSAKNAQAISAGCGAKGTPLERLAEVYRRADEALFGHGCDSSTECCRFGITGREPYVTMLEVSYLKEHLRREGKGLPGRDKRALPLASAHARKDERACPLLTRQGTCAAYEGRPFGCRTFFCERRTGPSKFPRDEVRELLAELSALAEEENPVDPRARPLTRAL